MNQSTLSSLVFKTIVIDAVFSQEAGKPFDCVSIMRYIKENEISGKTYPHHRIDTYLDKLAGDGFIKLAPQTGEFTLYIREKSVESR